MTSKDCASRVPYCSKLGFCHGGRWVENSYSATVSQYWSVGSPLTRPSSRSPTMTRRTPSRSSHRGSSTTTPPRTTPTPSPRPSLGAGAGLRTGAGGGSRRAGAGGTQPQPRAGAGDNSRDSSHSSKGGGREPRAGPSGGQLEAPEVATARGETWPRAWRRARRWGGWRPSPCASRPAATGAET